jgi:SAM-dependent methyltransferase
MDDQTKTHYSAHAESVSAGYARAHASEDLLSTFRGCRKILDLGCGNGRDLAALLRDGKDLRAISCRVH